MAEAGRRGAPAVVLVLATVLAGGVPQAQTVIRGGARTAPPGPAAAPLARALAEADRHPERRAVIDAIRRAGRTSPAGDGYLLGAAALESGFRPDARSARSSALGPFQFLEGIWLDTMGTGSETGAARALGGRVVPAGAAARRRALLDLRRDPETATVAALRLTEANRRRLSAALGREPTGVDLYFAHLLGAGGPPASSTCSTAGRTPRPSRGSPRRRGRTPACSSIEAGLAACARSATA